MSDLKDRAENISVTVVARISEREDGPVVEFERDGEYRVVVKNGRPEVDALGFIKELADKTAALEKFVNYEAGVLDRHGDDYMYEAWRDVYDSCATVLAKYAVDE